MAESLAVEWLGRVAYAEALELQQLAVEARRAGSSPDRLLLLEHPAVVTLGRGAREENLLAGRSALAGAGVEVHRVSRGGDVTYHAPGQLVGYPIIDLAARGAPDVHAYLRDLESSLIVALEDLGVPATRRAGMTGVFAGPSSSDGPDRKIASIGVGLRHWITLHGFALNVSVDLGGFDAIVPCGLRGVEMTSVARELGCSSATPGEGSFDARARDAVTRAFAQRFG